MTKAIIAYLSPSLSEVGGTPDPFPAYTNGLVIS